MPRYKKHELEYFMQVDSRYLEQFRDLDEDTQKQILKGLRKIANDAKVSEQDRKIAHTRARRLKAGMA